MARVNWFKFTQLAIDILPKKHIKNINNHYVVVENEKFMVMTSKPVNGMPNYYISAQNIEGQNQPQYLTGHIHNYNPSYHVFETTNRGNKFYDDHKEIIDPIVNKITSK